MDDGARCDGEDDAGSRDDVTGAWAATRSALVEQGADAIFEGTGAEDRDGGQRGRRMQAAGEFQKGGGVSSGVGISEHEIVGGFLLFGLELTQGEPGEGIDPKDALDNPGEDEHGPITTSHMGDFVEESEASLIGGPFGKGRRQKNLWTQPSPGEWEVDFRREVKASSDRERKFCLEFRTCASDSAEREQAGAESRKKEDRSSEPKEDDDAARSQDETVRLSWN